MPTTQISAHISQATRNRLERHARAPASKKAHLIESALLHHLQALDELPPDVIIPPRIVASRATGIRVLERLSASEAPTPAMEALMRGEDPGNLPA